MPGPYTSRQGFRMEWASSGACGARETSMKSLSVAIAGVAVASLGLAAAGQQAPTPPAPAPSARPAATQSAPSPAPKPAVTPVRTAVPAPAAAHAPSMPAAQQTELVKTYCATCHSEKAKAGGLSLADF